MYKFGVVICKLQLDSLFVLHAMFQIDIPLSEEVSPAYIGHLDSLLKKFFATSMMGDFYVKMVVLGGRFCFDSMLIGHLRFFGLVSNAL